MSLCSRFNTKLTYGYLYSYFKLLDLFSTSPTRLAVTLNQCYINIAAMLPITTEHHTKPHLKKSADLMPNMIKKTCLHRQLLTPD